MGLWQRVRAFFTSKPKRARSTWDPITNPFDAVRVAEELRLEERGRELGAAGIPLESDTSLSGPESKAVLAVERAQTDYIESYQLRLKSLHAQTSRSDLSATIAEAEAGAEQFERRAANLLTENAAELQRCEAMARSRREALERFRAKHRRIELPHYPSTAQKVFYVVLALGLIVVETGLNSSFFAKGLGGGILEGLVEAAGFSVVNVGLSMAAGAFVVRYVNHVQWSLRLLGYVGTTAAVAWLVALALGVSHYRDALVSAADDAGTIALQTLIQRPFVLSELSSWVLSALSLAAGLCALWEGYNLDERYPGYGRVHRKAVKAAGEYDDAISSLRAELATYRQDLLGRIEQAYRACAASIVDLKGVIADKQRLGDEMPNQIRSLQSAMLAMVKTFRTSNDVGRQERPSPGKSPDYFKSTPRLAPRELPDFSTYDDAALLARQEALSAGFLLTQADVRARIQSAFNDRYNSLMTVNELFDPNREPESAAGEPPADRAEPALSATVIPLRSAGAEDGVSA